MSISSAYFDRHFTSSPPRLWPCPKPTPDPRFQNHITRNSRSLCSLEPLLPFPTHNCTSTFSHIHGVSTESATPSSQQARRAGFFSTQSIAQAYGFFCSLSNTSKQHFSPRNLTFPVNTHFDAFRRGSLPHYKYTCSTMATILPRSQRRRLTGPHHSLGSLWSWRQ